MVYRFVDEVHGASGNLRTIVKCLSLRVQPWKRRQQRRVHVEDSVGKGLNKHRRDDPHVTRETDQIDLMRLVEARLRPTVQIDSKSIEAYYREQFVPKLKQSGASEISLAEVSGKIRELLTEQKVSELLVSWLQTLRSEGQVRTPGVTSSPNDPGVQSR